MPTGSRSGQGNGDLMFCCLVTFPPVCDALLKRMRLAPVLSEVNVMTRGPLISQKKTKGETFRVDLVNVCDKKEHDF